MLGSAVYPAAIVRLGWQSFFVKMNFQLDRLRFICILLVFSKTIMRK